MRRTLIIVVILLVLIGASVAAYFYFSKSPSVIVAPAPSVGLPTAPSSGTGTSTSAPNVAVGTPKVVSARLVQISTGPVVPGEAVVDLKATSEGSSPEVAVNYIERQSGNVFSYLVHAKTLTRINNKTIPGIQSATWLPDASTAFVRYLSGGDFSTINTYALSATSSTGFFLPQNLSAVAATSTGILTLTSGVNGSIASLSRIDGSHSVNLFTSPLSALQVSFAGKNQYLAFSKPSSSLLGDAFLVGSTGRFSRIAGPLNGLVALASPSGKWILVSSSQDGSMQMKLVNTATNEMISLPVATIADKCVWAADDSALYCGIPTNQNSSSLLPDDWYQGAVQFSDRIWKINVTGRYAQLTLDFSTADKGDLDATALAINPSGTVLVFVNKNDGSLWSYSL